MSSDRSGLAARGERALPARRLQEEVGRRIEGKADAHPHTHAHTQPSFLCLSQSLCATTERASAGLRRIDAAANPVN